MIYSHTYFPSLHTIQILEITLIKNLSCLTIGSEIDYHTGVITLDREVKQYSLVANLCNECLVLGEYQTMAKYLSTGPTIVKI